jgi:hypothetical protein
MTSNAGTACHWRHRGPIGTDLLKPAETHPPAEDPEIFWTGFAAFRVAAVETDGSLCLFSRSQIIFVHDSDSSPACLHPEWWGTLVKDEEGKGLPTSTWCPSIKEAIDEAVYSTERGIQHTANGFNGHEWEDQWWMVWELTLYSSTVTALMNMNAISPGAVKPAGPKQRHRRMIKTWNISRPIDMTKLTGWHRRTFGLTLGRCEKHLVKKRGVWEDVKIQDDTKLTHGMCEQWGCFKLTSLFNGKCHECWNTLWANDKYANLSDDPEWILDCERPMQEVDEDSSGTIDVD